MNDESETTVRTESNPRERGKWVSGLVALLGLWLIVAALVFVLVPGNFWNYVLVGVLLIALGGYNYAKRASEHLGSVATAAFVALLGIWLVISPWIVDAQIGGQDVVTEFGFWNSLVVGVIVFLLGAYSAYEARDTDVGATAGTR